MNNFFINPVKQNFVPSFDIKNFNLGNGIVRPALVIKWSQETHKSIKKTLLLENGELLSEYVEDILKTNLKAYSQLVEFSNKNLKEKYLSVHNIIVKQMV